MTAPTPPLSIAIPVFDHAETVVDAIVETRRFCDSRFDDYEILVVDDGSRDESVSAVESIIEENGPVTLLRHETHLGIGAALRTAIETADKNYFTVISADGRTPVGELQKLLPLLNEADIVVGMSETEQGGIGRRVADRLFRQYLKRLTRLDLPLDGTYLFPLNTAKVIAPAIEADSLFFSLELIERGVERGMTVTSAPIVRHPSNTRTSIAARIRRTAKMGKEAAIYSFKRWYYFTSASK